MAWKQLKIGAGGFIAGIDIHADGTKIARTDTAGAWIKRPGESVFSQVVSSATMPAGDLSTGLLSVGNGATGGPYEIRIAPTNSSRMYMSLGVFNAAAHANQGYFYRSNDAGRSWSLLPNFPQHFASGNDQATETNWPYLAIDPNNADIVYVGTPSSGLFKTIDGGASWSAAIAAVGTGTSFAGSTTPQGGGHLIAFDNTSLHPGNVTQGIYVSTYGVGVFHSTNGGTSWTQISGAGTSNTTLTTHQAMICDQSGVLYLVDNAGTANPSCGFLNKFSGGVWSQFGSALFDFDQIRAVAVDPANANHIVAIPNFPTFHSFSNDGGATWNKQTFTYPLVATDIPWLAATDENPLAGGAIVFDPSQSNVLYFGTGIGIFKCSPSIFSTVQWSSESADIEQLVVMNMVKPPGGSLIVNCMDRPVFAITNPNAYATKHGLSYNQIISHGIHAEYASSSPSTIVTSCFAESGYSNDGGSTWNIFGASYPGGSGSIAASTPTNFVYAVSLGGLFVTQNAGSTWTQPATAPTDGWGNGFNFRRQAVAADRVNIGTLYAYNTGPTSTAGVYRSTDSGVTWALASNSGAGGSIFGGDGGHAKLKSVPGNAGHLFWTPGQLDDATLEVPAGAPDSTHLFYICTNALTTCTFAAMSNVRDVWQFGFGKALVAGHYPSVYIYGFVDLLDGNGFNGGVWRCDDAATSPVWTKIGDLNLSPTNHLDKVNAMDADMDTFGNVYVGFIGSGGVFFSIDTVSVTGFPVIHGHAKKHTRMIAY